MDPFRELLLLKHELPKGSFVAPWPELEATGISRQELEKVILAFGDNAVGSVALESVQTKAGTEALAAEGIPVRWHEAPSSTAEGKPPQEEGKSESEEKGEEQEEKEKPIETKEESPSAQAQKAGCIATTSFPNDKRILAVGASLRALLLLDSSKSPADLSISSTSALAPSTAVKGSGIRIKGETFKTPDHYLGAMKASMFGTDEEKAEILRSETGTAARALAHKLPKFDEALWKEKQRERVFTAAFAFVRGHRPAYYELLVSGTAALVMEDTNRQAWAEALCDVRFLLQNRHYGAVLAGSKFAKFVKQNRLAGVFGIKANGLRLQQLCNDVLNKGTAITFQRLLYALNNGRNLAPAVSRSGVVLLISDMLYKESTPPEMVNLCLNVIAALSREMGTVDKEVSGFLLKYYLDKRDTWAALGGVELIQYHEELTMKALDNILGRGQFGEDDLYVTAHSAAILSKMATGSKGKGVVSAIAKEHLPAFMELLESTRYKTSMDEWNELQEILGTALIKILTVVTSYIHKTKSDDPAALAYVSRLTPFLSPVYNEEIQAFAALVVEQTQNSLSSEVVESLLHSIEVHFLDLQLPPPDRAEPLCDLLCSLSPSYPKAAEIINALGLHHFGNWALPVMAAVRNSVTAKSGYALVPGFSEATARILRQALDNSDESAVSNLCETARILSQSDDGTPALLNAGILSPLLQWAEEVELDVVQTEILQVCQTLTEDMVIDDENMHLLELVIRGLPKINAAAPQGHLIQMLHNFASAGTPKAIFEKEMNVMALPKAVAKENHKKANRFLHSLGIKTGAPQVEQKAEKLQPQAAARQGAKKGEVDRYQYIEGSQNPFQLLVAKRPAEAKNKGTGTQAQQQQPKESGALTKKEKEIKAKSLKGFTLIAPIRSKGKEEKQSKTVVSAARQKQTQRPFHRREYDRDYEQDSEPVKKAPPSAAAAEAKKDATIVRGGLATIVRGGLVTKVTAGASITTPLPKSEEPTQPMRAKERVVKVQGSRGGINLNSVQSQLSKFGDKKAPGKKPSSWAALAKSANEKEENERRAKEAALEEERVLREEKERLEKAAKQAAAAPPSVDPVAAMFAKLLPDTKVRSAMASQREVAEMEEDRRILAARRTRQEEERLRREEAARQKQEAEEQQRLQEERERREREARLKKEMEDAEAAAATVSRHWGMSTPSATGTDIGTAAPRQQQQQQQQAPSTWSGGGSSAGNPIGLGIDSRWSQPASAPAPAPATARAPAPAPTPAASNVSRPSHTDPWAQPGMAQQQTQPRQFNQGQMWQHQQQQQQQAQQQMWQQQQASFRQQQQYPPQSMPQPQQQRPVTQPFAPTGTDYYAPRPQQQSFQLNPKAGNYERKL